MKTIILVALSLLTFNVAQAKIVARVTPFGLSRPDALGNTNHNTNHKCTTGIATSGTYQTVNLPSGPARVLVLNVVAPVSRENYVFNTVASLYFGEGDIRTGEIFVSAIVSNKNGLDSRQQFPLLSVCTDGEFSVRGTSTYDDVD